MAAAVVDRPNARTIDDENKEVSTRTGSELVESGIELKERGNARFKEEDFLGATTIYTQAIEAFEHFLEDSQNWESCDARTEIKDKFLPMLLCNRALCNVKLENFGASIVDASRALTLTDNKLAKAYFRRATAYIGLSKYELAVKDFRAASRLTPSDKDAALRLKEAQKLLSQQKFAEAIRGQDQKPPSEIINIDDYRISDDYKGPRYDISSKDWQSLEFFKEFIDYLKKPDQRLSKRVILQLALDVMRLSKQMPNVVDIKLPDEADEVITICGDVHGQFYDLVNIFELAGWPSPKHRYLFNGDFVDRGSFSVEVITTLYLARLIWPESFFLARGNHESRRMTKLYGFEGEMRAKASSPIYDVYCESFDWLPLAHSINGRVFVVHGGLSAKPGITIAQINAIDRVREEDDGESLMSDLLWADPQPFPGSAPSKRGVSMTFGPDITEDFLKTNGLEWIIRSHEMKAEGYEIEHGGKLITLFSAPNYCDQMGNKGAFVTFNGKELNDSSKAIQPQLKTFAAVPHPAVRAMQYANPMLMF